jgi:hypothetical protein
MKLKVTSSEYPEQSPSIFQSVPWTHIRLKKIKKYAFSADGNGIFKFRLLIHQMKHVPWLTIESHREPALDKRKSENVAVF